MAKTLKLATSDKYRRVMFGPPETHHDLAKQIMACPATKKGRPSRPPFFNFSCELDVVMTVATSRKEFAYITPPRDIGRRQYRHLE